MIRVTERDVNLGVERQVDFTRPGGAFRINGLAAIPNMNRLNRSRAKGVDTIDWHPKDHVSFIKYGVHCMPNTPGAVFDPDLDISNIKMIFMKGTGTNEDIYDSFDIPYLLEFMKILDPDKVIVNGSAIPICPSLTAMSSAKHFETYLVWDACCFINGLSAQDLESARASLGDAGVHVVYTKDFIL